MNCYESHDMSRADAALSATGRERRAQMLTDLQAAMHHHHARKQRRRTFAATSALAFTITIGVVSWLFAARGTLTPTATDQSAHHDTRPVSKSDTHAHESAPVRIVRTKAGTAQKYIASDRPAHVTIIDDEDELLQTLEAFGHETGLIRINGRLRLTNLSLDRNADQPGADPPAWRREAAPPSL